MAKLLPLLMGEAVERDPKVPTSPAKMSAVAEGRSPFIHDAVAIAVTGARHLGRWEPRPGLAVALNTRPAPLLRRRHRRHTSRPELERATVYRQSASRSVQAVFD